MAAPLKALRVAKGWSQADLAEQTGLSRAQIGSLEVGRRTPSLHALCALSRVLGLVELEGHLRPWIGDRET
jgi:transcriptional regulator with XRE-family HTH domain